MSEFGISAEWLQRLAGSLLHFVWQGALLALLAAVVLRLMARRPAAWRYAVAVFFLGLMLLAPVVTIFFYPETGAVTLRLLRILRASVAEGASAVDSDTVMQWTGWIVLGWAAGVLVFSGRLIAGWFFSLRLVRSAQSPIPDAVERVLERVRTALLKTGRMPRLLIGERVTGPMVFGWLRPVVLLPVSAITGLSEEQLLAVLAHELAHIRRHDFFVNALQHVVESVLFYHPAVWWLSGRIRKEREHCCDDLALSVCGDRFAYAQALIELERMRSESPALAVSGTGGLTGRVRRMLGAEERNRDWQPAMAALLLLAICTVAGLWQADPLITPAFASPPAPVSTPGVAPLAPAPLESAISALAAIAIAQTPQAAPAGEHWVTTWGAGYVPGGSTGIECCNDQTVRMFMRVSAGGRSIRLRLSNTYGSAPLFLGEVHIALHDRGSEIDLGSSRPVLFGRRTSVEIPIGQTITSDPVDFALPAMADVAISIYAPNETGYVTGGQDRRTGYVVPGDHVGSKGLTGAKLTKHRYWVSGIEVLSPANSDGILIVGDPNTYMDSDGGGGWPSLLAARLQGSNTTRARAVVFFGDTSRVLGQNTNSFEEMVSSQVGVRYVMLCPDFQTLAQLGFGFPLNSREPFSSLSPEDRLIRLLKTASEQARNRGAVTIGCTLPPVEIGNINYVFRGPDDELMYTYGKERRSLDSARTTVNEWIRTSGAFDAVQDFDSLTRDPANAKNLKPEFRYRIDPVMNVFNDRAHQVVAGSIDLSLFSRP